MRSNLLSACLFCVVAARTQDGSVYSSLGSALTQRFFSQDVSSACPNAQKQFNTNNNTQVNEFVVALATAKLNFEEPKPSSREVKSPGLAAKEADQASSNLGKKTCTKEMQLPSIFLTGKAETPLQVHFKEVFPWKINQLQMAIKYGNRIGTLAADFWGSDGIRYNKATEELQKLHDRSRSFDAKRKESIKNVGASSEPQMMPYTGLMNAPHLRMGKEGFSVKQMAREEAKDLMRAANSLGFTVRRQASSS